MMEDQWQNDPSKWIWGVFYYNKDDKRIFPPKRIPWMGWTLNFANPYSIITMVGLLVLVIGLTVFF